MRGSEDDGEDVDGGEPGRGAEADMDDEEVAAEVEDLVDQLQGALVLSH